MKTKSNENRGKPKKVFFSYSYKDKEVIDEIKNYLKQKYKGRIEPIIDDEYIKTGDDIIEKLAALLSGAEEINILLIFISPNSIQSNWVNFELNLVLHNKVVNNVELEIFPVIIEGEEIPESLKTRKCIDLRDLINREKNYEIFANEILGETIDSRNDSITELNRLQRMIQVELKKGLEPVRSKISSIVDSLKTQTNIMTPKSISIAEEQAIDSIWIVSTHLCNDLYDEFIKESVRENMSKKGLNYYYFVREIDIMKRREEKYRSHYKDKKFEGKYHFIKLENPSLIPFDEVVIYDAEDDFSRWGYVQIRYNEENLFLRLSDRNLFNLIAQLTPSYNDYKKKI